MSMIPLSSRFFLITIGALGLSSLSAAQYGAANRADLVPSGNVQLQDLTARVYANHVSGDGSNFTGLLANFEKALTQSGSTLTAISGTFAFEEGETRYGGTFKVYSGKSTGTSLGILLKSGQSPVYSAYQFYELPLVGDANYALRIQAGAGIAYSATTRAGNFSYYLRAALPLKTGYSAEFGYVGTLVGGGNEHSLLLGIGKKF